MSVLHLPWLEIAILLPVLGALAVNRLRDPQRAARLGTAFTGATFLCTLLAWAAFGPRRGPCRARGVERANLPVGPAAVPPG